MLPVGRGECIVALDADVIPEAHWLRSVTAYLVDNACLSATIALQYFRGRYNTVELDVFVMQWCRPEKQTVPRPPGRLI